jgi:hypothetical protein
MPIYNHTLPSILAAITSTCLTAAGIEHTSKQLAMQLPPGVEGLMSSCRTAGMISNISDQK